MKKLKMLARLGIPALVLGMLTGYADYIEGTGRLPIAMIVSLTAVMGFLLPKGRWRWTVLIGMGVHLAHISGHLIDSSPIPPEHVITFRTLMRDLIPALIGTYTGIFAHRYYFEGDTWNPKGTVSATENMLNDLEVLAQTMETTKKIKQELVEKGEVLEDAFAMEKVNLRLVNSRPNAGRPAGKIDPEKMMDEVVANSYKPKPPAPKAVPKVPVPPLKKPEVPVPPPVVMASSPLASMTGFSWPAKTPLELLNPASVNVPPIETVEGLQNVLPADTPKSVVADGRDALERIELKLGLKKEKRPEPNTEKLLAIPPGEELA